MKKKANIYLLKNRNKLNFEKLDLDFKKKEFIKLMLIIIFD